MNAAEGLQKLAMGDGRGYVTPGRDGWLFWDLADAGIDVRVHLLRTFSVDVLHIQALTQEGAGTHSVGAKMLRLIQLGVLQKAIATPDYRSVVASAFASERLPTFDPAHTDYTRAVELVRDAPTVQLPADLKVVVPDGPRTDEFYEQVARLYLRAVVHHPQPVAQMATANGVPASTINGWLQEARRRERHRKPTLPGID